MRSKLVFAAAALATTLTLVGGATAAQSSTKPSVVKISALANGLKYSKSVLRAHPGRVKIVFTNLSTISHNVRIESGEQELGGTKTIGKGRSSAIVRLKKGTYNFYCSVPGHEDAGMRGKLIVT